MADKIKTGTKCRFWSVEGEIRKGKLHGFWDNKYQMQICPGIYMGYNNCVIDDLAFYF